MLGFTVQAMAQRPGAHELIVSIATDPVFGPVILLGEGGTAVELRKDHAVALPPHNISLARDMVARMALDARVRLRPVLANEDSRLAIRPYPSALEERVQLAGRALQLRPIRPDNASPADMRLHFFMARREVPHSELARYSQIDYDRDMTFIALAATSQSGDCAMVGEVRAVCDPDNVQAEFAIQVAADWQGKGLGRLLLEKLVRYLRERGTTEIVGQCLGANQSMAALARQVGFQVSNGCDQQTMALQLSL